MQLLGVGCNFNCAFDNPGMLVRPMPDMHLGSNLSFECIDTEPFRLSVKFKKTDHIYLEIIVD